MPRPRHSAKARSSTAKYGHKYRALQVSDVDTATASGLKSCIRRLTFIDDDLMYRPAGPNQKRGKMKNKKALTITLETCCDDRLKELSKNNLDPFIRRISGVSARDVAQWINQYLKATKIGVERLRHWRKKVGYSLGGILELIHEQSFDLGNELQATVAEWNALNRVYGKILRGEWKWPEDDSDDSDGDDSSNDNQMRIVSKADKKKMQKYKNLRAMNKENKNKKKKETNIMEISSGSDEGNGDCRGSNRNGMQREPLERKDYESTSNCWQRNRTLAVHPFFRPMGFFGSYLCAEFYIFYEQPGKYDNYPITESTRKDQYICDEEGEWFENDKKLMAAALLHDHGCTKHHRLMLSQGALIQNVYRNKIIGLKRLSVSPVWQYLVAVTLAEDCKLLYRFETEAGAFIKNRELIMNTAEPNTYEIGEWDNHYQGKTRLPRSAKQIEADIKRGIRNNTATEWWARLNPCKIAEYYQKKKPQEWGKISNKWMKYGVTQIMHEYLTRFFPEHEQKALDLGILKAEHMRNDEVFKSKTENDEMLSFI